VKRIFASLIALLIFFAPVLRSQAAPAAGGWISTPSTWNVAVGGSYLRSTASGSQFNFYGWNASISEYPYASHRWFGATLEMSGAYNGESRTENSDGANDRIRVNRAVYTYAAGPSVTATAGRVRPFGHVLFGAVNSQTRGTLNGSTLHPFGPLSHGWPTHAGMQAGGGLDLSISSSIAIRAQADWMQVWASNHAVNFVRAETAFVYRF
jgi:hypothetical protein